MSDERGEHAGGRNVMRSAVLLGDGKVTIEERPMPEPGPGQVRIALEGCGLCASSIPVWEGRPWFQYPSQPGSPGHEGWGRIDALGEGVTHIELGARVATLSYASFAEYDLADVRHVVPIPNALADAPFPGEALGCAMNIFRRADIAGGQTVAIVGIGFLGALLTQLATGAGARVIALSRRTFSLDTGIAFGAVHAVRSEERQSAVQQVMQLTQGKGCERVIEAVGMQDSLDLATELVAERGKLVIAGYHQDSPRKVDMQLWNWRGIDVINAHERDPLAYVHGIRAAAQASLDRTIDPGPLYTHRFALDELADAFAAIRDRPSGVLKALVTM
jgi:threonine dehydrogenase-like Zn-dependent dehydrogenase